jgi:hypothetical protein
LQEFPARSDKEPQKIKNTELRIKEPEGLAASGFWMNQNVLSRQRFITPLVVLLAHGTYSPVSRIRVIDSCFGATTSQDRFFQLRLDV